MDRVVRGTQRRHRAVPVLVVAAPQLLPHELGLDAHRVQAALRDPARRPPSTDASRKTLRSAPGSTTVPMSRPATTIPPPAASSRWRSSRAARTSGTRETEETAASTASVRIAPVASSPSRRTRVSLPEPSSPRPTLAASGTRAAASSVAGPLRAAPAR